jgi:hypothetical protein
VIFRAIRGKILFVMKLAKAMVSVSCPVCYSNNSFDLSDAKPATLACDDCRFILSEPGNASGSGRCIFCGNEKFYIDSFLALTFFGNYLVCYVCEAKYKGFRVNAADEKFDGKTALELRTSEAAVNLKERVRRYNQSNNL